MEKTASSNQQQQQQNSDSSIYLRLKKDKILAPKARTLKDIIEAMLDQHVT